MEQQDLQSNYRRDLKERILTVAMQAFKLRGIRNVRMDDIATTLGISKRTIYEIYSNKEELLLDGIMREDKARKRDSQLYAQDKNHTVMDIIFSCLQPRNGRYGEHEPFVFQRIKQVFAGDEISYQQNRKGP